MKKIFCGILVLALVFSLSACSKKEPENATIEIKGNPTTGYEWTYKAETNGIVAVSDEYKQDSSGGGTGAGGTYIFVLSGIKEGETTLTFTYSRSWEPNPDTDATKVYKVTVDKKLNVKTELVSETNVQ